MAKYFKQGGPSPDLAGVADYYRERQMAASASPLVPAAPHAFHADYRPSYRKDAAEDGWARALEWFKAHGVK